MFNPKTRIRILKTEYNQEKYAYEKGNPEFERIKLPLV